MEVAGGVPRRRTMVRAVPLSWPNGGAVLLALGMAAVVGADGAPAWRAVRITIVGVVTALVVMSSALPTGSAEPLAQTVVGLVAVPAAATITFAYGARSGLCLRSVAGAAATIGALTLLGHGIVSVGRRARGWRRWLVPPAYLLAAFLSISTVFPAVYATNVPRPQLGAARPSDLGLRYEDVSFRTHDGVTLSGWYVPSANRAAVVLLHGASSTRSSVLDEAAVLARHGYGVLLFDARGHGRSGGRAMEFGWYGDDDTSAAVSFVRHRPDVDPDRIGAVGMSMGGEEVIGAMASDVRIKIAVAEGATNRTDADKRWLADAYGLRGRAQLAVEWLTYRLADVLTAASEPISLRDATRTAAPRKVLLIAAGTVHDEQLAAEHIRAGSPGTVDVWVVDGAGHTGGLRAQPTEWALRVIRFLDGGLLG